MQQPTELSFQQIYNQLLAGANLVLYFESETNAETFRTRMHHHKAQQDKFLEGLGLANSEERTVLRFRTKKEKDGGAVVAHVQFALPSPLKKYPVIILEEKDLVSGAEVSSNLATS